MSLAPEDLPERVEAWTSIDRIVWQDVDADRLTSGQLAALSGWVAGGGRLVIAGGTAGPEALAGFPDALLPYRPTSRPTSPAASLAGILGELPPTAHDPAGPVRRARLAAGHSPRSATGSSPRNGHPAPAR